MNTYARRCDLFVMFYFGENGNDMVIVYLSFLVKADISV